MMGRESGACSSRLLGSVMGERENLALNLHSLFSFVKYVTFAKYWHKSKYRFSFYNQRIWMFCVEFKCSDSRRRPRNRIGRQSAILSIQCCCVCIRWCLRRRYWQQSNTVLGCWRYARWVKHFMYLQFPMNNHEYVLMDWKLTYQDINLYNYVLEIIYAKSENNSNISD